MTLFLAVVWLRRRCCSEVEDTSELGCGNKHREHGRTGRPKVVVVEEEEEEEYQLCP